MNFVILLICVQLSLGWTSIDLDLIEYSALRFIITFTLETWFWIPRLIISQRILSLHLSIIILSKISWVLLKLILEFLLINIRLLIHLLVHLLVFWEVLVVISEVFRTLGVLTEYRLRLTIINRTNIFGYWIICVHITSSFDVFLKLVDVFGKSGTLKIIFSRFTIYLLDVEHLFS